MNGPTISHDMLCVRAPDSFRYLSHESCVVVVDVLCPSQ